MAVEDVLEKLEKTLTRIRLVRVDNAYVATTTVMTKPDVIVYAGHYYIQTGIEWFSPEGVSHVYREAVANAVLETDVIFEEVEPTHLLELVDGGISEETLKGFKSAWDKFYSEFTVTVGDVPPVECTQRDLDKAQLDVLGTLMQQTREALLDEVREITPIVEPVFHNHWSNCERKDEPPPGR